MNEHIQITPGAILFKNIPWSSEIQQQLKTMLHLRDNLVSSSWGYLLKHGSNKCYHIAAFEWMRKRCTPPRLTVEQCYTWRTISYCHPLKHGYRQCYHTTTLNECRKGHPPRRLIVGQFVLKPKGALHRMSMCNKNNIIDEAETFLFTIWLDELRRIYWEEHWAYKYEPFTASYEMHVWMIG
jgi:hypothetical protein